MIDSVVVEPRPIWLIPARHAFMVFMFIVVGMTVLITSVSIQICRTGQALQISQTLQSLTQPKPAANTTTTQTNVNTKNVAQALQRINQNDVGQYANQKQHDDW